jgi:hypothetical protein
MKKIREDRPSPPFPAADYMHKREEVIGNDGEHWISVPDKKGVYHWQQKSRKSAFAYYEQLQNPKVPPQSYDYKVIQKKLKDVAIELKKSNIFLYELGWDTIENMSDDANDEVFNVLLPKTAYIKRILKDMKDADKRSFDAAEHVSCIYFTNFRLFWASRNGILYLWHGILRKDRNIIKKVFDAYLGNTYVLGNAKKAIQIKLPKI